MFGVSGLRVEMLRTRVRFAALFLYVLWSLVWVVGHVAGGVITGCCLGWLGNQLPEAVLDRAPLVLAVTAGIGAAQQLGLVSLPLPALPRQVPRRWMVELPWSVTALGYGLQLGSAVATRIHDASTYVLLVAALLSGSPQAGALMVGMFGLTRALPAIAIGPLADSPARSLGWALRLDRTERWSARASGLVQLCAALVSVSLM